MSAARLADAKAHLNLLLGAIDEVVAFHAPHGELSDGASRPMLRMRDAAEMVKREWAAVSPPVSEGETAAARASDRERKRIVRTGA